MLERLVASVSILFELVVLYRVLPCYACKFDVVDLETDEFD
jgi:hypothetical protein